MPDEEQSRTDPVEALATAANLALCAALVVGVGALLVAAPLVLVARPASPARAAPRRAGGVREAALRDPTSTLTIRLQLNPDFDRGFPPSKMIMHAHFS